MSSCSREQFDDDAFVLQVVVVMGGHGLEYIRCLKYGTGMHMVC